MMSDIDTFGNAGNRSAYIEKEAQSLQVSNPVTDHSGFDRVNLF